MSYNPHPDTLNLIQAIASTLALAKEDFPSGGIPASEDGMTKVVHIDYADGDPEIWLRTSDPANNERVYIVRTHRLGESVGHTDRIGMDATRQSYARFLVLESEVAAVTKVAEAMGQDPDAAMQAWYEDVLNEDQQRDWNRWISGGFATEGEWRMVRN